MSLRLCGLFCVALFGSLTMLQAQDPPKPGPEHESLAKMAGVWDAVVTGEGMPPTNAVSTFKMECGGLWLVSNFESDFGGIKFQGKGLDTYDSTKKKYVSIWVDSMSTQPMTFEGEFDAGKKALTMFAEGPGPDGKPVKWKSVGTWRDDDHHTFKMYKTPQGGEETLAMTIEYTRKK